VFEGLGALLWPTFLTWNCPMVSLCCPSILILGFMGLLSDFGSRGTFRVNWGGSQCYWSTSSYDPPLRFSFLSMIRRPALPVR